MGIVQSLSLSLHSEVEDFDVENLIRLLPIHVIHVLSGVNDYRPYMYGNIAWVDIICHRLTKPGVSGFVPAELLH